MIQQTVTLTERPAWNALKAHHRSIAGVELRALFAEDPKRGERLALAAAGVYLDYSKNRLTEETLGLLVRLADESAPRESIDAIFPRRPAHRPATPPRC